MLGAGLDESELMKSQGGLACTPRVLASVTGRLPAHPPAWRGAWTRCPRCLGSTLVMTTERYKMHWFYWFHCGL